MTKISRRNANYWINAVAEGGDDYYTKPGEAPGEWMGELADELGLQGQVTPEAYAALLDGKNPVTGDFLVRRPEARTYVDASGKTRRKEPILGYDIRFSAPKSVSLLWAVGSRDVQLIIEQAMDEAIRQALAHLELHACFVQRGKGGKVIERGTGFISMNFLHRSSRAGDPALHAHVVTANMTRAESDGRWLSLANPKQHSPLLREAKSTGYVFQAVLRQELGAALGVEWTQVTNGYADIAFVPRDAIDHFSTRRKEIVREMARVGTDSPAAAEVAAYRTRDAKDYGVDPDNQRKDWRAQAAEFGLTEASINAALSRTTGRDPARPTGSEIDRALAAIEATKSHFDRRDLLCALADQLRDGADAASLRAAVDRVLDSERVITIHRAEAPLETTYFTTPRIWQMEKKLIAAARSGATAGVAVVDDATVAAVLSRHDYLSAEQVAMVRRLTSGGERIVAVAALPGTGKTTALKAAREIWRSGGVHGIGIAAARSASDELRAAKIVPATSITDFLLRTGRYLEKGQVPLPVGTVVIMDESSTASTPQIADVLDVVEACDGKLVLVGDPRQIGAVGPGGAFGHLTNLTDPIVLTEIRRQRDPLDREVVELAHAGRGSDAIDLLRSRDRVVIADTLDDALNAQVLDWHRDFLQGGDAVMIARRIRDVADLNARARELLVSEGRLGSPAVKVGGFDFAVGDRLITRVNSPAVSNRQRWRVVGVDASETHLKVRALGGEQQTLVLSPRYLSRRTDNGEPAVQHAYALTTYATESKTFDSAYSLLDSGVAREDFVVAVSRAAGTTTVYGVAATELLDADLGPATREVADEAHDIRVGAERVASEFSAVEVPARMEIAKLGPDELAARRNRLLQKLPDGSQPEVAKERLSHHDHRASEMRDRLTALAEERHRLNAGRDAERITAIGNAETLARRQIARLDRDRPALASAARAEQRHPASLTGTERTELAMIEDRLLTLRRADALAERIQPSRLIVDAIGPRPQHDAGKESIWNEGLDLVLTFRQLHRVRSESSVFGPRVADPAALAERRAAEARLREIQHALQVERTRAVSRSTTIAR